MFLWEGARRVASMAQTRNPAVAVGPLRRMLRPHRPGGRRWELSGREGLSWSGRPTRGGVSSWTDIAVLLAPEGAFESRRNDQVLPAQLGNRIVTEADQRRAEAVSQEFENVLHSRLSVCGQAPKVGTTDHDGPSAEGQRFGDIGSPADASVQEDFHFITHGVSDRGQGSDAGRGAIQVVPTMV